MSKVERLAEELRAEGWRQPYTEAVCRKIAALGEHQRIYGDLIEAAGFTARRRILAGEDKIDVDNWYRARVARIMAPFHAVWG